MKGDNDHSTGKQDNKASSSGGKSKLPLYICAGVVAVALAIGGYFVFADNAANPGVENNVPQGPNDPYNNGGGITTGEETTSPTTTTTISPTPEATSTQQPPEPAPSWEVILDPTSGEVTVFTTSGAESPYVSPYNTTVPTAPATVAPPPSAAPSKAPATPNNPTDAPINTLKPTPGPTPIHVPTPTPTPKAPETQAPKTGPEYTDIARSKIAKKAGVVEVIECKWSNAYDAFGGKIKYTDGTVTVTTTYEYYLEYGTLFFTYQDANGEYKAMML